MGRHVAESPADLTNGELPADADLSVDEAEQTEPQTVYELDD